MLGSTDAFPTLRLIRVEDARRAHRLPFQLRRSAKDLPEASSHDVRLLELRPRVVELALRPPVEVVDERRALDVYTTSRNDEPLALCWEVI